MTRARGAGGARSRELIATGCALSALGGWNVTNVSALAEELSAHYGTSLAAVGLLTTALLLTHALMQIPGGRVVDAVGPTSGALAAAAIVCIANGVAIVAPDVGVVGAMRALTGVGSAVAFAAGMAYVRAGGGSFFAQGVFGGLGVGVGGLALFFVPLVEPALGWSAPFSTAVAVGVGCAAMVAAFRLPRTGRGRTARLRDVVPAGGLWRLAAVHSASFGLSLVVGNWIVTLLRRHDVDEPALAGAIGSSALVLSIISRPLGGWLVRDAPDRMAGLMRLSLVTSGIATLVLAVAGAPLVFLGAAVVVGIMSGLPFGGVFVLASQAAPTAPALATGFVNTFAGLTAVVGTAAVGLSFQLPGDGRLGFALVGAIWCAAALLVPSRASMVASRL